jgi:hypothetical protein
LDSERQVYAAPRAEQKDVLRFSSLPSSNSDRLVRCCGRAPIPNRYAGEDRKISLTSFSIQILFLFQLKYSLPEFLALKLKQVNAIHA